MVIAETRFNAGFIRHELLDRLANAFLFISHFGCSTLKFLQMLLTRCQLTCLLYHVIQCCLLLLQFLAYVVKCSFAER